MSDHERILSLFPDLPANDLAITSPTDVAYNCIAWAAGATDAWWWPSEEDSYWPPGVPMEESVDAFVALFAAFGYEVCPESTHEPTWEKVAIYAVEGRPTHAARQLPDGRWTSKLGRIQDIVHLTTESLAGLEYGVAIRFMRRPRSDSRA